MYSISLLRGLTCLQETSVSRKEASREEEVSIAC